MGTPSKAQAKAPEATQAVKDSPLGKRSQSKGYPAHPLWDLQAQVGNRAVNRLLQAKLKVGQPHDHYEQEADQVADTVMRMSGPSGWSLRTGTAMGQPQGGVGRITPLVQRYLSAPTAQPLQRQEEEDTAQMLQRQEEEEDTAQTLQRQEEEEDTAQTLQRQEEEEDTAQTLQRQEEEEEEAQTLQRQGEEEEEAQTLQRQEEEEETAQMLQRQEEEEAQAKASSVQTPTVTPSLESGIQAVRGGGQPLSDSARSFFEPRFGADFSDVRVHTDAQATTTSRTLNAQAFTIGSDIFFDAGRYEPHTATGQRLLAHELTHTVQQHPGRAARFPVQRQPLGEAVQRRSRTAPRHRLASAPGGPGSTRPVTRTLLPIQDLGSGPSGQLMAPPMASPATPARLVPPATSPSPAPPVPQPPTVPALATAASAAPSPQATLRTDAAADGPTSATSAPGTAVAPAEGAAPVSIPPDGAVAEAATAGTDTAAAAPDTAAEPEAPAAAEQEATAKGTKGKPQTADAKKAAAKKAPASPQRDPNFRAVVKRAEGVTTSQRSHAPAATKSQEAQAASQPDPASEVASQAQANQVKAMEQAETPAFSAAAFKADLKQRIADLAPKKLGEADEFKKGKQLNSFKAEVTGKAKDASASSQAPLKEKTEAQPDPSGLESKSVTELPPADPGQKPAKIGAEKAIPKSKSASEVETPLMESSEDLDRQMAAADITETQLAKSNEPKFMATLEAKQTAQTAAIEAPKAYRQQEKKKLAQAKAGALATSDQKLEGMYGDRTQLLTQVESQQGTAKSKDEAARNQVISDINGIYEATKTAVETILNPLEDDVADKFETGANAAKQAFEDYVAPHMDKYKERYDGLWGAGRWLKDKLLGVPPDVTAFFGEGRRLYLEKMDGVLDDIADYVAQQLNEAKQKVTDGKQEVEDYVAGLDPSLQQVGEDAAADIQGQFDDLEDKVNSAGTALVDTLAKKYTEKVKELDDQIEEMKKANQPWFERAFAAIAEVIETINNLRKLLQKALARIVSVIGDIISDPIRFLGNLIKGLTQGFQNFVSNILTHLQTGLIGWLTGALGPTGITLPDNLFSLPGIFSLVMQVLGLTWDYMRGKAVQLFGEPVVAAMEKGAEIFQVLRTGGPEGLWQYVKDEFTNLKEMVIDQIKEMVITEVIKAGVKWILGLLSPAGALIKAAMAIYEIVTFFIDRAAQIGELINAVIDAVAAIAKGAIGGAAQLVENALAKALPVVIGFLASLLGISGLAKKVQAIIKRIRSRIDRAITKLLKKAKTLFKGTKEKQTKAEKTTSATEKATAKNANLKQEEKPTKMEWWKNKTSFTDKKGKPHTLFFAGQGKGARLKVKSNEMFGKEFITEVEKVFEEDALAKSYGLSKLAQCKKQQKSIDKIKLRLEDARQKKAMGIKFIENQLRDEMAGLAGSMFFLIDILPENQLEDEDFPVQAGKFVVLPYKGSERRAEIITVAKKRVHYNIESVNLLTHMLSSTFKQQWQAGKIREHLPRGAREQYLGATPGKASDTGKKVIKRYKDARPSQIRTVNGIVEVEWEPGKWHPLNDCDMSHEPLDAVDYWNEIRKITYPKSQIIRDWMLDPNNYVLEPAAENRSRGSRNKSKYLPPLILKPI